MIVAAATYGAALGLSMRPAVRAVVFAAISVGAIQYAAIFMSQFLLHRPGLEGIAWTIQKYAGADARDVAPTASAAAFAAVFTTCVSAITQSGERRRRVKRVAAIED